MRHVDFPTLIVSESTSHMNLQVVIDRTPDSVYPEDSSEVTAMPQGMKMCSQTQAIVNSICNCLNEVSREIYELTGANLDR